MSWWMWVIVGIVVILFIAFVSIPKAKREQEMRMEEMRKELEMYNNALDNHEKKYPGK